MQSLCGDAAITCKGELYFRKLGRGEKIGQQVSMYWKHPEELPPMQSACSGLHSLFLDVNGGVWGLGFDDGQLGFGQSLPAMRMKPTKIPNLPVIHLIGIGDAHSIFVDFEGFAWSCGLNSNGQLGLGDTTARRTPQKITSISPIASIHLSQHHSIFVDFEGGVWVCGQNAYGQLGVANNNPHTPERIGNIPPVVSIKGQHTHTMLLDVNGYVWGCGRGTPLGLGGNSSRIAAEKLTLSRKIRAIESSCYHSLFLDEDGAVWYCGESRALNLAPVKIPVKINEVPSIQQIFVGPGNSILVDTEGYVWFHGDFATSKGATFINPPQRQPEYIRIMLDTRVLRTKSARNCPQDQM